MKIHETMVSMVSIVPPGAPQPSCREAVAAPRMAAGGGDPFRANGGGRSDPPGLRWLTSWGSVGKTDLGKIQDVLYPLLSSVIRRPSLALEPFKYLLVFLYPCSRVDVCAKRYAHMFAYEH